MVVCELMGEEETKNRELRIWEGEEGEEEKRERDEGGGTRRENGISEILIINIMYFKFCQIKKNLIIKISF